MAGPKDGIPREPVRALIERLIAERDDRDLIADGKTGGGLGQLARECAAFTGTEEGWARRIYSIRTGKGRPYKVRWCDVVTGEEAEEWRPGDPGVQQTVSFEVFDNMLTALDLTHLWFTEFADHVPVVPVVPERTPVAYPEAVAASCPRCNRKLNPEYEPEGTVAQFGHCALCVARLTTNRLRRGKWTFSLMLALYERYLLTGESDEHLLRAHGVPATPSNASNLASRWKELGWPRRTRGQSKRLNAKLHPRPVVLPKILRDRGGEPLIRQLHALHWHRRQSMNSMARELAPQWDVSVSRLTSAMSVAFSKLGLPAHDRIAMTVQASTKNGLSPRDWRERKRVRAEAGLTQKGKARQPQCGHVAKRSGKQCERPALKGEPFCQSHDPARMEATAARLHRMRAVSHDPSKFVPLAPLQAELLEAGAMFGWGTLDRLYGGSKGHLSAIARGKADTNGTGRIGARRARRIRVVIAQAKADALIARVREVVAA